MRTSRQRVLEYIQSQRIVSVADICRALRMTAANARHHLGILEEQGLVKAVGKRQSVGKGRPAVLYSLSEDALGHNLDRLSAALLNQYLAGISPEDQTSRLRELARVVTEQVTGPQEAVGQATSLTRRLFQAVQRLNEMHYAARWEAHAQAPRILFEHCPYAAILAEHPELCSFDAVLLEELLGTPAHQAAKLASDPRGGHFCLFLVEKR